MDQRYPAKGSALTIHTRCAAHIFFLPSPSARVSGWTLRRGPPSPKRTFAPLRSSTSPRLLSSPPALADTLEALKAFRMEAEQSSYSLPERVAQSSSRLVANCISRKYLISANLSNDDLSCHLTDLLCNVSVQGSDGACGT